MGSNKVQTDLLIIGGGLTGAALVLALANSGYSTRLIDAKPFQENNSNNFDARTLALAPASIRILKGLNLWDELETFATPIDKIHISQRGSFGVATLNKEQEPLGYVIEMQHIQTVFQQKLCENQLFAGAQLKDFCPERGEAIIQWDQEEVTVETKLIVAADGINSSLRNFCKELPVFEKEYDHQAIVANIGLSRSHHHCAYERFTSAGPLALLPMTNKRSALVWSLPSEQAQKMIACSESQFLSQLQQCFGYRLGRFMKVGKRSIFPLRQVLMPKTIHWPIVFIGNAAHTLHPVAGQGFNLGLRDIATLAQCIAEHGLNNKMLETYQKLREHDQKTISLFTDSLVQLFGNKVPGMHFARGAGLVAMDNLPLFKKIVGYYARGFGGAIPDLVCGIPLDFKDSYGKI